MSEQQYARERALILYISALERGDFDQMSKILKQAETDQELEKMIEETHAASTVDLPEPTEEERAFVRRTLESVLREQG